MYCDWVMMQKKCNSQILILEDAFDKKLLETVKIKPGELRSNWMDERQVCFHVFSGDKWLISTKDYKTAYDVYMNCVDNEANIQTAL